MTTEPPTTPRIDGRPESTTIRPLSCELGTLTSCDGSADWKSGHTSVLAAVHGPMAPRIAQHEEATQCTISVVITGSNSKNSGIEREWETFLSTLFGSCVVATAYHPRSTLTINLQVLHADGSVLGACIHAAVASLLDAGIEMKVLPLAITCSVADNELIVLDPVAGEDERQLVLILDSHHRFLSFHSSASLKVTKDVFVACRQLAERAMPAVQAFLRMVMEQKTLRENQTLWSLVP